MGAETFFLSFKILSEEHLSEFRFGFSSDNYLSRED